MKGPIARNRSCRVQPYPSRVLPKAALRYCSNSMARKGRWGTIYGAGFRPKVGNVLPSVWIR
ncbi:hypothetical protein sS8_2564 [Methylocaldum marinum]|uniref:Uncharacterized protein n=1 Tax=Methylocaldum marinum TaxID=1432792 RepID=A0A250KS82_9GAMM|nr:hypothetical protein sS8_2564 [Methylocaldum marinum]